MPDVTPAHVGLSARRMVKPALRPVAVAGMRCALRVVDPVTIGVWAARLAQQPDQAATEIARQVSSLVPPTVAEIVGNYARGLLLSGRAAGDGEANGFEWLYHPLRTVITRDTAHVPKRLRPILRRGDLEVRFNQDFDAIIEQCQAQHGAGWLTAELIDVYRDVHRHGFAGAVGTYRAGQLVGGFWGVQLGRVFSIGSMFHTEDHAGAVALATVAESLSGDGPWSVVDCVSLNANFARYGFTEIPAEQFTELVLSNLS